MRLTLWIAVLVAGAPLWAGTQGDERPDDERWCIERMASLVFHGSERLKDGVTAISAKFPLVITPSRADSYFIRYLQLWDHEFDQANLVQILERIVARDPAALTPENVAQLKRYRKSSSVLRNAFLLFDRNHRVPGVFEDFVVRFGKLNDAIADGASTNDLAKKAEILRSKLAGDEFARAPSRFRPTTSERFAQEMKRDLDRVKELRYKTELTEGEQHELRKLLREFLYFQLAEYRATSSEVLRQAYQTLFELAEELGLERDDYLRDLTTSRAKRKAKIPLSSDLRRKINAYLDHVFVVE